MTAPRTEPERFCVLAEDPKSGSSFSPKIRKRLSSGGGSTGDVSQDADLEYDLRDYPKLLQLIEDGKADVVYGSLPCWETSSDLSFQYVNRLESHGYGDLLQGLQREVIQNIRLESNWFGLSPK